MLIKVTKVASRTLIFFFAAALLVWSGCSKKAVDTRTYISWVEDPDNGLRVNKTIGAYSFRFLYQPHDYLALRRLNEFSFNRDSIKNVNEQLGNLQYFVLRIQGENGGELMREGIKDDMEYYRRMEYFMGPMQDDLSLIDGKDTLACVLFHFERNYGLAPYNDFLLGFEGSSDSSLICDKTLLYDDYILGTGPVHLTISGKDINNTPILLTE